MLKRVLGSLGFLVAGLALTGCPGGSECRSGGTGTIVVTYSGLPAGATGTTHLNGASAQTITSAQTLAGMGGGTWTVSADKAVLADARVRTAYQAVPSPASFCVRDGQTQTVEVKWEPIATSNKLWVLNGNGGAGELLGFASESLAASGSPAVTTGVKGSPGRDLTFDKDGNLWAFGATTADAMINRFPAADLATGGAKTPDRKINITGLSCLPAVTAMAFDKDGNLWITSACKDAVFRLDASVLNASGSVSPSQTLAVVDPAGLAFDAAGNLWVGETSSERLLRYDAAQLTASPPPTAALKLGARASENPLNMSLLSGTWLAFDKNGDLWGSNFGANIVFRVAKEKLAGTGTLDTQPAVKITIGVSALLEGFAFDEEGGLWTALSAGKFGRLAPSQLTESSTAGAPTTPATLISSADAASLSNVAFYPAPAALPLYHRLP